MTQRPFKILVALQRIKDIGIVYQGLAQPEAVAENGDGVMQEHALAVEQSDELVSASGDQLLDKIQGLVRIGRFGQQRKQRENNVARGPRVNMLEVARGPFALAKQTEIKEVFRQCGFRTAQ